MDKRFILALLLSAIVIVLTQMLFPAPKAPPGSAAVHADSGLSRDSAAAAVPAATAIAPAPLPVRAASAQAAALRADSTTVETPRATYRFVNVGAAPLAVTMGDYPVRTKGPRFGQPLALGDTGPLLRYRVVAAGGRDTIPLDGAAFTATRVAGASGPDGVRYTATIGQVSATIEYAFAADSYLVRVHGRVEGAAAPAYLLVDLPPTMRSGEADTLDDQRHLAYAYKSERDGTKGIAFSKLEPGERKVVPGPVTWVAAKDKYFLIGLLVPKGGTPIAELDVAGGPRMSKVPTLAAATAVMPLSDGAFALELYAGPQEWKRLSALGRDFENANPYGGFLQGVVQPFATIVVRVLLWMHQALKLSYGWVLVVFGIGVRLILWPLYQSSMRTSLRMQVVQPELAEAQKKYASNPQKQQEEIMRIYKEHGMSPFSAFSGCLPMLLPMPVLFALFFVFGNTIEFRGVSFLWLADISQHDPTYILPVLMGLSMYALSWIGLRAAPSNPQTKMMSYIMPVFMTVILMNYASGLNLYYAVQNVAALPQQWIIAKERAKRTPVRG